MGLTENEYGMKKNDEFEEHLKSGWKWVLIFHFISENAWAMEEEDDGKERIEFCVWAMEEDEKGEEWEDGVERGRTIRD